MDQYAREYLRRLRLLVWNEMEQRPRVFLRIYIFLLIYTIGFVSLPILMPSTGPELLRAAGLRAVLVLWTIGLLVGAARVLDRRPVRAFGLRVDRQWITDSLAGVSIGLAIPTVATGIGLSGGWLVVVGLGYSPTLRFLRQISLAVIVTLGIAIVEELVFRGYVLTNALEGLDLRWLSPFETIAAAWGLSALLFAVVHSASTLVDSLHFLGAGLVLGLAYLLTGKLALPIGTHAGFNFASTYMFPAAQDSTVGVVHLTSQGPAWLAAQTGLVQTGLLLPATFAIVVYVWWQYGIEIRGSPVGYLSNDVEK